MTRCGMLMVDDSTCKLDRGHSEPCQSDTIRNRPGVLCRWCFGTGERTHPADGGGIGGECSRCEGSGRVGAETVQP